MTDKKPTAELISTLETVAALVNNESLSASLSQTADRLAKLEAENHKLKLWLAEGEDIISGLEAEADNAGIDLHEVRAWWCRVHGVLPENIYEQALQPTEAE